MKHNMVESFKDPYGVIFYTSKNGYYYLLYRYDWGNDTVRISKDLYLKAKVLYFNEGGDEQWKRLITHQENTRVLEI